MRVPYAIITPFIVVISIIGSTRSNNSMLDVFITVIFDSSVTGAQDEVPARAARGRARSR